MKVLFGLVAALMAVARANNDDDNGLDSYYCAELFNGNSGNSAGYFQLKLDQHGWSKYAWSFDITGETCSSGTDLTYHLHVGTTDSTGGAFSCAACGGHYDPFFGCSGSSSEAAAGCDELSRTTNDYGTRCVTPAASTDEYMLPDGGCEVGDLSSKFGHASPQTGSMEYSMIYPLTDYFPPMLANYNATTYAAGPWNSVVFHCPATNERLACGNFVLTDKESTGTACASFSDNQWSDDSGDVSNDDDDDDAQLSVASGNALIIMTVLLGLTTLGLGGYVWKTTKGQRSDASPLNGSSAS